jgi:hypothetical protein
MNDTQTAALAACYISKSTIVNASTEVPNKEDGSSSRTLDDFLFQQEFMQK